jgi:hypothetical protein|tara:strand:+ start:125 stop:316 length:192 start_codon:yes stop_codon:yes gene_type:complete
MNHLNKLLKISLEEFESNGWNWPKDWNVPDQIKFIDKAIEYSEQQEMYEQCKKLYEVKKKYKI